MKQLHYRINGPTSLSFSGGRSSAYMLRQTLDANTANDLKDLVVMFANTGKEMPQTLDFVKECGERWGVDITWVEYIAEKPWFKLVNYDTASRSGEPFEAMIRISNYLPNPVVRKCTVELKVRAISRALISSGWDRWDAFIGMRADEMRRVRRLKSDNSREDPCAPMAEAGVTKKTVTDYWNASPFDLNLPNQNGVTRLGNCDLCYLKGAKQIESIIRDHPHLAEWWIKMETGVSSKGNPMRFRNDRPSYAQIAEALERQSAFDFEDSESLSCYCGD